MSDNEGFDLGKKEYRDSNDAYEAAINFLAIRNVGSIIRITQEIVLKRTK